MKHLHLLTASTICLLISVQITTSCRSTDPTRSETLTTTDSEAAIEDTLPRTPVPKANPLVTDTRTRGSGGGGGARGR